MDEKQSLIKLVENYSPSAEAISILKNTQPILIASVTGGGKNTIISSLLKDGRFHYVVSHTTRKPRISNGLEEKNGQNYWFVELAEMLNLAKNGRFIEIKVVHQSDFYGTSVGEFKKSIEQSKTPLLEIDVQGVEEIISLNPKSEVYFILPPSFSKWQERLKKRGDLSELELKKRMITAQKELQFALSHDYFRFIINDDLEVATDKILSYRFSENEQTTAKKIAIDLLKEIENLN